MARDDPRLGAYMILSLTTDSGVMFTTNVGMRLDASHVRRDFRALCQKAGIEGVWAPR